MRAKIFAPSPSISLFLCRSMCVRVCVCFLFRFRFFFFNFCTKGRTKIKQISSLERNKIKNRIERRITSQKVRASVCAMYVCVCVFCVYRGNYDKSKVSSAVWDPRNDPGNAEIFLFFWNSEFIGIYIHMHNIHTYVHIYIYVHIYTYICTYIVLYMFEGNWISSWKSSAIKHAKTRQFFFPSMTILPAAVGRQSLSHASPAPSPPCTLLSLSLQSPEGGLLH